MFLKRAQKTRKNRHMISFVFHDFMQKARTYAILFILLVVFFFMAKAYCFWDLIDPVAGVHIEIQRLEEERRYQDWCDGFSQDKDCDRDYANTDTGSGRE